MNKPFLQKLVYLARNVRSRALFGALARYCSGDVLDVGGYDFYLTVQQRPRIRFRSWTNIERDAVHVCTIDDPRYRTMIGDDERMPFHDQSFDTVVNVQVLEHTFEPMRMVREIARVLKPGGHAVCLIPQTAVLHHPPIIITTSPASGLIRRCAKRT